MIYTLYLYSRKRKLENHYIISGQIVFLLLYVLFCAITTLILYFLQLSSLDFYVDNNMYFLILTLTFAFSSPFYSRFLLSRIRAGKKKISPIPVDILFTIMASILVISISVLMFCTF
jgi:hypothetical protein